MNRPSQTEASTPHPRREGPGGGLLLSSAYLAPVHYYTKLYSSALAQIPVIEEQADHYVKQTYRNRCIIAGDDGPIALTIPVSAPERLADGSTPLGLSKTPTGQVLISDHGDWRHQHWQAIVSAYKSSPYFDYYVDDFHAVFHGEFALLADFNAALRNFVLESLDLHPTITVNSEHYLSKNDGFIEDSQDFRETIRPKIPYSTDPTFHPVPYWQVFASRHGFLPNLSIIDLLFNMGPGSRLILKNSVTNSSHTI